MTPLPSAGVARGPVDPRDWIWDSSALVHYARAGRCPDLFDLVRGRGARHLLTPAVRTELEGHRLAETAVAAGWACLDDPSDDLLGSVEILLDLVVPLDVRGPHNLGEATVLALAEEAGATAVLDDRDACTVARGRGIRVVRTLRLAKPSTRPRSPDMPPRTGLRI